MTSLSQWADDLLTFRNLTSSDEHRIGLTAWALAEGDIRVPRCSGALWNPLDTEEPAPGDSLFNPQGVRNYPDERTGLEATWATLDNGRYADIVAALSRPDMTADELAACRSLDVWGTGSFAGDLAEIRADPSRFLGVAVPGAGAVVPPQPTPGGPDVNPPAPQLQQGAGMPPSAPQEAVRALQALLQLRGHGVGPSGADGRLGPATAAAVRAFQAAVGIAQDGIAGPVTWGRLVNG